MVLGVIYKQMTPKFVSLIIPVSPDSPTQLPTWHLHMKSNWHLKLDLVSQNTKFNP